MVPKEKISPKRRFLPTTAGASPGTTLPTGTSSSKREEGAVPKAERQEEGSYLSVGVLVVLLVPGVVVLLDEAEVLLPFPLQGQLPALRVGREIALHWESSAQGRPSFLTSPWNPGSCATHKRQAHNSELGKELSWNLAFPALHLGVTQLHQMQFPKKRVNQQTHTSLGFELQKDTAMTLPDQKPLQLS